MRFAPGLVSLVAAAALASACASPTQQTWTPTVDTYNNSRAQFLTQDSAECRELAQRAGGSAGEEAVRGAVGGGLVGAAGGAAIGAVLGNPGRGAALGAAALGIGAGASRASQSNQNFQNAYRRCMQGRGHNVIG
jgi:hypothetical protein